MRVFLSRYRGYLTCPDCGGARLRREARDVRVAGRTIDRVSSLTVREAHAFFSGLEMTDKEAAIADKVLKEIRRRLAFLSDVGLDYLTLDRLSSTLSGGEAQRINLATSLGSALVGTLYVLDEPSIGLHSRDNQRLITILRQLRDQGNTVIVVEHDADMIKVADHIVDLGLGAGEQGGRVVFSGTLDGLMHESRSLTSKYLRQELAIPIAPTRRRGTGQKIRLLGATEHNLKDIDVSIPLNTLTVVTGVSGSGKSTLVHDVLYAAIKRAKGGSEKRVGAFKKLEGVEFITDAVLVDQAPIGRTPRSNPVTYLKAFDPIRELFASTKDARSRGLTASHFSFNVPGGRCEACQGEGEVRVEMQFLADVFVPCDQCDGKRFKPQVLEVKYRGRSIRQVLDLDGPRGADVLRQLAEGPAPAAGARRDRPRLSPARAAGDDAVGRGGAADQDRGAPVVDQRRAAAVRARRADNRAALRRHRQAADGVPQAARSGALARRHRAQPRCDQDGRLHHRPRTRRRRRRRLRRRRPALPNRWRRSRRRTPGDICGRFWRKDVRMRMRRAGRQGRAGWLDGRMAASCWRVNGSVCSSLPAFRPSCLPALRPGSLRAGDGRPGKPRCGDPAAHGADAEGGRVSRSGRAARQAVVDRDDAVQLEAIAAELNIFLAEKIVPRKRVGFVVEKRTAVAADAIFRADRWPSDRGRCRPRCWTRCGRPRATTIPASGSRRCMRSASWRSNRAANRRREMLRTGGRDLAAMIGAVDPSHRYAALRVIGRVFERRLHDDPIDQYVGDAVIGALNEKEKAMQAAAMQALGAMRYERAVQGLIDLFQFYRGKGDMAESALDAIAHIAHPSSVPLLVAQLGSKNDDAQGHCRGRSGARRAIAPG